MRYPLIAVILGLFAVINSSGQTLVKPSARWTSQKWDAQWIAPNGSPDQGVYHFRKSFNLPVRPSQFIIHISADNRYRLFVNGNLVNEGPQISDRRHWRFESLDIATLLQTGSNLIAIQVWSLGDAAPVYDMGKRVALIVQGDDQSSSIINTDKTWKCLLNTAVTPIIFRPGDPDLFYAYYAAGPMDRIGTGFPWNWEKAGYDDSGWATAEELQKGSPFQTSEYGDPQWELLPRSIPLMERTYQKFVSVRRSAGIKLTVADLNSPVTIPANQKVTLLLDQGKLTTAFPEWILSKGNGSEIKATYAEAMMNDIKNIGHRDSINGKSIHGIYDLFFPDGGEKRTFSTLSYRAFRFVQVDITTAREPLVIEKVGSWFTGYPFIKNSSFAASDPALTKVFDIGWYTARLCAYETYMDCPYWERLQYIGDTRIQALISFYDSGDDRLARNALEQFEWSMQYDGLTYSRYPSSLPQYIPNYSLVWVLMVNDYMMYRNDPEFVRSFLPGMRRVLDHFKRYLTEDRMMLQQPYWDFIDHSYRTKNVVDASTNKRLTTNSLFYAYTLSSAAKVFSYFNEAEQAKEYEALSHQITESVKRQCWDEGPPAVCRYAG
ncbi:MAG: alpha-L-rhamnosidase N-terminal domain-containing protein [Bacteroidota bacterium]